MVQFCKLWVLFQPFVTLLWLVFSRSWRRDHDPWDTISLDLCSCPGLADQTVVQQMCLQLKESESFMFLQLQDELLTPLMWQ